MQPTEPSVSPFAYGHRPEDVTLLAKHSFLAHIGPQDLGAFLELLDQVALPAGTVVFRQGEEGEHMFFVLEGQGNVHRGAIDVGRIGPGDHFGETAILGHRARSATVQADTVMRLARLSRGRFLSLGAHRPQAARHFMAALAGSVAASMTALRDDVGLLARQRSLPRRSVVKVMVGDRRLDVGTGTLVAPRRSFASRRCRSSLSVPERSRRNERANHD